MSRIEDIIFGIGLTRRQAVEGDVNLRLHRMT